MAQTHQTIHKVLIMEAAYEAFVHVRKSWRAGLTDEATFVAATKVYEKAKSDYDLAFKKASDIETSDVAEATK